MGILYIKQAIIFTPLIILGIGILVIPMLYVKETQDKTHVTREEKREWIEKIRQEREENAKRATTDRHDRGLGGPTAYEPPYGDLSALRSAFSKIAALAAGEVSDFDSEIRECGLVPSKRRIQFSGDRFLISLIVEKERPITGIRCRRVDLEQEWKNAMETLMRDAFWKSLLMGKGFDETERFAVQLRQELREALGKRGYWYKPDRTSQKNSAIYDAWDGISGFRPSVIFNGEIKRKRLRHRDDPIDLKKLR